MGSLWQATHASMRTTIRDDVNLVGEEAAPITVDVASFLKFRDRANDDLEAALGALRSECPRLITQGNTVSLQ